MQYILSMPDRKPETPLCWCLRTIIAAITRKADQQAINGCYSYFSLMCVNGKSVIIKILIDYVYYIQFLAILCCIVLIGPRILRQIRIAASNSFPLWNHSKDFFDITDKPQRKWTTSGWLLRESYWFQSQRCVQRRQLSVFSEKQKETGVFQRIVIRTSL